MNETIITNWNTKIKQTDIVWVLGDFAFGSVESAQSILNRLSGTKHLIRGNHDKIGEQLYGWETISDYKEIKTSRFEAVLCHYAMRVWNRSHKGSFMLYGHSHGTLPDDPKALSIDVGVDCHNFSPLSEAEIVRIMNKKKYQAADNHGRKGNE